MRIYLDRFIVVNNLKSKIKSENFHAQRVEQWKGATATFFFFYVTLSGDSPCDFWEKKILNDFLFKVIPKDEVFISGVNNQCIQYISIFPLEAW